MRSSNISSVKTSFKSLNLSECCVAGKCRRMSAHLAHNPKYLYNLMLHLSIFMQTGRQCYFWFQFDIGLLTTMPPVLCLSQIYKYILHDARLVTVYTNTTMVFCWVCIHSGYLFILFSLSLVAGLGLASWSWDPGKSPPVPVSLSLPSHSSSASPAKVCFCSLNR